MPYGIKKSKGGDSPANVAKIERCVSDILANRNFKSRNPKETRKVAAIKICKSQIGNISKLKK